MRNVKNQLEFPIVFQNSHNDCGLACLKSLAIYYGRVFRIDETTDNTPMITEHGMTLYALRTELERMGLKSLPVKCSAEDIATQTPLPAIALLNNDHYIIIYDADETTVSVADPAWGLIDTSYDGLRGVWYRPDESVGILLAIENR